MVKEVMAMMLAANVTGVTFADIVPFPELSAPRAVTQGPHDHLLANYFAINAWSPDNRYLLALETDIKDELPDGRPCTVGLVNLEDGNRFIPVMETRAWNFQEAAMAHWLPSEKDAFVVNDLRDGRFVAVVKNWRTGEERIVPHPVSAVSEDGSWALSINYARLYLARPDYGYAGEGQNPRRGVVFPEDDGLWRVDLKTGEAKLIVSCVALKDMVPAVPETGLSYICHTVISKDMKRIYFLSRSVSQSMEGVKKFKGVNWQTTAFTCNADGSCVRRCFPDGWGSSHFNWKPALSERDARTMIVTCKWQNKVYTHVEFTVGEEEKSHQVGGDAMNFDGHCIYSPDGNFISGDGYWDARFFRHWKMVRLADNAVKDIGEFYTPPIYRNTYCRCDLHPRWRPDGQQLAFNSVHEGSRQVYVIDSDMRHRSKRMGFKFVQWNIGHFALGCANRTTVEPDSSDSRSAEYRAKIAELGADFLGVSEFDPEFDKAGRLATNVVFSSYPTMVVGPKNSYQCNAVFSRFPCIRSEIIDYETRCQKTYFIDTVFRMGTNEVHVVQSHLDWAVRKDGYVYNKGQMRQLIEHFRDVPYVIIAADFNVNMVREYSAFVEAGYTLANGGPAGMINTARPHPKKPNLTERILDNIVVKGFRVSDIFTEDDDFKLSDHRIFGCTLDML